jgi:uncharacterized protein (TIGR02757 family)
MALREILIEYKSLEAFFQNDSNTIQNKILNFQTIFLKKIHRITDKKTISNGLKFLIGNANPNSSNKRMFMYLRWMVRNKFPDYGIFQEISPRDLLFPLDTHISQLANSIFLYQKKSNNITKTIFFTSKIKQFYPDDPLILDFPLSRLGILKVCKYHYVESMCNVCIVKRHCTMRELNL